MEEKINRITDILSERVFTVDGMNVSEEYVGLQKEIYK
jgi:hypothetical protein